MAVGSLPLRGRDQALARYGQGRGQQREAPERLMPSTADAESD